MRPKIYFIFHSSSYITKAFSCPFIVTKERRFVYDLLQSYTLFENSHIMEEETKALFDLVVETASGKQVCSEAAGFHDMAIFKQGVTL